MATRHRGREGGRPPLRSCPPVADRLQADLPPLGGRIRVREYRTSDGRIPYREWLERLRDREARARIVLRVERLGTGLLEDCRSVGAGVFELRIHHGPGYRVYFAQDGPRLVLLLCAGEKRRNPEISERPMPTGKTTRRVAPSVPHEPHRYLTDEASLAAYLNAAFEEEGASVVPMALRTATAAIGGIAELARRTGLSRETLYRTLSRNGNPRLDTLLAILDAFGLRLSTVRLAPACSRSAARSGASAKGRTVPRAGARKVAGKKTTPAAKAAPKKQRPRR